MRLLLVILFLLAKIAGIAQSDTLTYCSQKDYTGYCLKLHHDSLFIYQSWSCLGSESGEGVYTKTKNKLILHFKENSPVKPALEIEEKPCANSDSVKIKIQLLDYTTYEPLSFANTWQMDANGNKRGKPADVNGEVTYTFKKSENKINLYFGYVGYMDNMVKDISLVCQTMKVYLKARTNHIENNTDWEYKIKKWNTKQIVLRVDNYDTVLNRQ